MTGIVWSFAVIAALTHIVVFVWEVVLFERPGVHHRIFLTATSDVPAVRLWAFGVGFYNLSPAAGVLVGVALWAMGDVAAGRTLVIYVCWFMFLSGAVLFIADRMGHGSSEGDWFGWGTRPGAASADRPDRFGALAGDLNPSVLMRQLIGHPGASQVLHMSSQPCPDPRL